MSEFRNVCMFLKSEGFHFLDNWVSECINYFKSNNPSISEDSLKKEVRQQWLLLNLRDVKVGAFPPNLSSIAKVILPNKYAVQVETIVDSGQSRYGQLQAITNCNLENIEATSKPLENENISRRCLTMTISDGVQELSAMEYEPIPSLRLRDPQLLPGFKIIVKGPVTCRRGMLMLKRENVIVCGGEVDTLIESNSLEMLLAASLGINADKISPRPYNFNSSVPDDGLLFGADDNFLMDVPIHEEQFPACDGTKNEINNSIGRNLRATEFEKSDDFLFDDDPFGDDDILMNVPETGDIVQQFQQQPPDTNFSGSKQTVKEDAEIIKQTSINQFFGKVSGNTKKNSHSRKLPLNKVQVVSSAPFVYLAQIVMSDLKCDTEFKVKAIIITLKSKPLVRDNKFSMKAQICDGSLSLDAFISSEITEHFLGFTPEEVHVMLKEKSSCSSRGEILKKAFSTLQSRLISLDAILNIRFYPNNKIPLVLSFEDPTSAHFSALKSRQTTVQV